MAYRLYVGNYPFEFSKDDVQNLFSDFDGVKVEKICLKENSKSFGFLVCDDIDQAVSVVKKMNKSKVSGRNLVVRANDDSLKKYVDLILQNDVSSCETPVQAKKTAFRQPHVKNTCGKSYICNSSDFAAQKKTPESDNNSKVSDSEATCSSRSVYDIYQEKHDASGFETSANNSCISSETANKLNNYANVRRNNELYKNNAFFSKKPMNRYQTGIDKNEHEYFETSSNRSSRSSEKSYHQSPKKSSPEKHFQPEHERDNHDQFNTSFNNFSRYSYTSDTDSQISMDKNSGQSYKRHDTNSCTWVSVTNFRIGIHVKTLYELFSDYKPLKVKMICNEPQKNRYLTEAHVCFPSREIADDVILNFDNTMFQGRIILVNDIEDLTIMNELLNISHS